MTPEQENNGHIGFEIRNKNPIKNPKEYEIKTIEDIDNCVTRENIDGFLKDFEMVLRMHFLYNEILKAQIAEGKIPEGTTIPLVSFKWIDDWKRKKKKTK